MRPALLRATLAALVLASAAPPALAQPADVPALSKLIESQPSGMDRSEWKEKRREAARKLGASKDKRAVPVLIKLAETETFDIIGDIAIEGLGALRDPSAAAPLQRIANDNARDKATRELAKKALAKLPSGGAATTGTTGSTTGTPGTPPVGDTDAGGEPGDTGASDVDTGAADVDTGATGDTGAGTTTSGSALLGERPPSSEIPAGPQLPDDTLAAYDRLVFAAGTATLAYDTVRKRPAFDADVGGRYETRVERETMAWGASAGAHVVAGFVSPEGRDQMRGVQLTVDGTGEARFYHGSLYGIGKAAVGVQMNYIALKDDDPANDFKDTRTYADLQLAIGGGYGRMLDVGGAIRVRRLARTLDAARALGKQIDPATARRLQLAWWGLRDQRSSYDALVATVAILREAGVLLGEPDAGLSYEILAVLRDSQLFLRPSGLDVQVVFGEGYLVRPDPDDPDDPGPTLSQRGRVEQLIALAGYGQQLDEDMAELAGAAYARVRLFAPDDQPSPWAVGGTARFRRFTYGGHGDPFGVLDLSATVQLSDAGQLDGQPNAPMALRIAGEAGFTLFMNQASGIRLAGTIAQDSGELFFGANLTATYGLLDGTFSGL